MCSPVQRSTTVLMPAVLALTNKAAALLWLSKVKCSRKHLLSSLPDIIVCGWPTATHADEANSGTEMHVEVSHTQTSCIDLYCPTLYNN